MTPSVCAPSDLLVYKLFYYSTGTRHLIALLWSTYCEVFYEIPYVVMLFLSGYMLRRSILVYIFITWQCFIVANAVFLSLPNQNIKDIGDLTKDCFIIIIDFKICPSFARSVSDLLYFNEIDTCRNCTRLVRKGKIQILLLRILCRYIEHINNNIQTK